MFKPSRMRAAVVAGAALAGLLGGSVAAAPALAGSITGVVQTTSSAYSMDFYGYGSYVVGSTTTRQQALDRARAKAYEYKRRYETRNLVVCRVTGVETQRQGLSSPITMVYILHTRCQAA